MPPIKSSNILSPRSSISGLPNHVIHDKYPAIIIDLICNQLPGGWIMSLLTVGVGTAIFGLISLIFWWSDFLTIIRGALPIFLLLGGALAVYVGYDEMQDKIREERQRQDEELERAREEIESAKAEAERYREELDKLKEGKQ
jgi:hypothetical protein